MSPWASPSAAKSCGHDYLLAFSCKTRYFCPSCHQKRVLLYGEWIEENVFAPVPHRQYVFALPRLLRHFFARRREWLGELCCIAERLLSRAYAGALPGGRPALIVFARTDKGSGLYLMVSSSRPVAIR
jgi:hypothetical protein